MKTSWRQLLPLPDALSYDQGAGEFSFQRWWMAGGSLRVCCVLLCYEHLAWYGGKGGSVRMRLLTRCILLCATGLYVTWPTSYEALVGRAKLKPGMSTLNTFYHPAQEDHPTDESIFTRRMGARNGCSRRCRHRRRSTRQRFVPPSIYPPSSSISASTPAVPQR